MQVGQTRCIRFIWPQPGHRASDVTSASLPLCICRCRFFACDVFFFGTALRTNSQMSPSNVGSRSWKAGRALRSAGNTGNGICCANRAIVREDDVTAGEEKCEKTEAKLRVSGSCAAAIVAIATGLRKSLLVRNAALKAVGGAIARRRLWQCRRQKRRVSAVFVGQDRTAQLSSCRGAAVVGWPLSFGRLKDGKPESFIQNSSTHPAGRAPGSHHAMPVPSQSQRTGRTDRKQPMAGRRCQPPKWSPFPLSLVPARKLSKCAGWAGWCAGGRRERGATPEFPLLLQNHH